jgi:hypothetical protein
MTGNTELDGFRMFKALVVGMIAAHREDPP